MATKRTIRAPTTSSLPNNLSIPSNTPSLVKALGRLSRQSLLNLIVIWLSPKNVEIYPPFLAQNSDDDNVPDQDESPYLAAGSVEEIREAYEELRQRKGGKREVIDRVLEGDWRHGITLGQLAMVDIQYLEDHPKAQSWSAFRLRLVDEKPQLGEKEEVDGDSLACLPRLHAATFLSNLQREIAPLVKAHYHLARSKSYPLIYLRIFITDSPYHRPRHGAEIYLDSARILYIAFPDSSPHVYTSMSASTGTKTGPSAAPLTNDARALRGIVRDALPKALSKPNERYKLEATSLTAKSLQTMLALRGAGRTNEANGAFSIFADTVLEGTPIDPRQPTTVAPEDYQAGENKENAPSAQRDLKRKGSDAKATAASPAAKRRKLAVLSRFGTSGTSSCQAMLNRLDIRLLDRPGDEEDDVNEESADTGDSHYVMSLSFTGTHVIAGFRKLAELGVVDPDRMPSWMTGEEGVSSAVIRRGRRVEPGAR